jgi:hypothetical protein
LLGKKGKNRQEMKKMKKMKKMKMAKMLVGLFVMLLYLHSNRFTRGEVSTFSGLDCIEATLPFFSVNLNHSYSSRITNGY